MAVSMSAGTLLLPKRGKEIRDVLELADPSEQADHSHGAGDSTEDQASLANAGLVALALCLESKDQTQEAANTPEDGVADHGLCVAVDINDVHIVEGLIGIGPIAKGFSVEELESAGHEGKS